MEAIGRRLRHLIAGIRDVLDPFGHEPDRARAQRRWGVDDSEYVTEWFQTLLRHCKAKTRCYETRRCVYHDSPELAARNYKVCENLFLEIEAGHVRTMLRPLPAQLPPAPRPPRPAQDPAAQASAGAGGDEPPTPRA